MFPKGVLLNNPGNLQKTNDEWVGMTKLQDNARFVRFKSPKYGIRAVMKTILSYDDLYGLNTISRIITRYAPPGENDTDSYIRDVSFRSGFSPNVLIDLSKPENLMLLAQGIVIHENGHPPADMPPNWYEEVTYHEAAMLALAGE